MEVKVKCKCRNLSEGFIIKCNAIPATDFETNKFKVLEVYSGSCPLYKLLHKCPSSDDCVLAEGDSFSHFDYDDLRCINQ